MNRRRFIGLTIGAGGLAVFAKGSASHGLHRVEQASWAFGARVSLIAYHESEAAAESALAAAFRELDAIEDVLSLYRPASQISRLNRDGALDRPHPDLVKVLRSALEWSRATGGAFDPTVQPLWTLHASNQHPSPDALAAARSLVDWTRVEARADRIRLAPGQAITLNGIAQGFAADRIREVLRAHCVRHALVNTGEFGSLGRKPEGKQWRIGIQHPRKADAYVAMAAMDDRFLATSGDYATPFNADFSLHHIFDPATGRSPAALASVTVLAPSGLEADALSTAIFVLGLDRGIELAKSRSDVDALLIRKNGDIVSTPNFPALA